MVKISVIFGKAASYFGDNPMGGLLGMPPIGSATTRQVREKNDESFLKVQDARCRLSLQRRASPPPSSTCDAVNPHALRSVVASRILQTLSETRRRAARRARVTCRWVLAGYGGDREDRES